MIVCDNCREEVMSCKCPKWEPAVIEPRDALGAAFYVALIVGVAGVVAGMFWPSDAVFFAGVVLMAVGSIGMMLV